MMPLHGITKELAWQTIPDEKNIAIKNDHPFEFQRRWFKLRNQTTFSTFLPQMFDGSQPVRMIQIGVFEGMDLVWTMQNVCTHLDSRVLAIDPWAATTKLDQEWMDQCCERAYKNLAPWTDKVRIVRDYSQPVLAGMLPADQREWTYNGITVMPEQWDLIVIDGDHNADAVFRDAVLSRQLIRPGGYLLFDDVRNRIPKKDHVAEGLGRFLEQSHDIELVWFHRFMNCYRKKEIDYGKSRDGSCIGLDAPKSFGLAHGEEDRNDTFREMTGGR